MNTINLINIWIDYALQNALEKNLDSHVKSDLWLIKVSAFQNSFYIHSMDCCVLGNTMTSNPPAKYFTG